ncbi:hypothetical protein S4A8_14909 [Salinisphaera sp. S4-8]|uniref:hypothetical protein n=1 Tax=Salinisphaera sp. S4-8 TaxID=633357 RepID=UPI00333FA325
MRQWFWLCLSWGWVLVVAGCATAYGPRDANAHADASGYVDREIKPGVHEIYYNANAYTSPKQARALWHRRAAELCQSDDYGYDLREDEAFHSDIAYASGMVYASNSHSPRFYGVADCNRSGTLTLFRATRAEQQAASDPDAEIHVPPDSQSVSQIKLTCNNYYSLTRHCSTLFGAQLNLSLDGVKFRISSSQAGDQLYIALPQKAPAYKGKYDANEYINTAYYLVKGIANDAGLKAQAVQPVKSFLLGVRGYLVAFDGNVYSLLLRESDSGTPTPASGLDVRL